MMKTYVIYWSIDRPDMLESEHGMHVVAARADFMEAKNLADKTFTSLFNDFKMASFNDTKTDINYHENAISFDDDTDDCVYEKYAVSDEQEMTVSVYVSVFESDNDITEVYVGSYWYDSPCEAYADVEISDSPEMVDALKKIFVLDIMDMEDEPDNLKAEETENSVTYRGNDSVYNYTVHKLSIL